MDNSTHRADRRAFLLAAAAGLAMPVAAPARTPAHTQAYRAPRTVSVNMSRAVRSTRSTICAPLRLGKACASSATAPVI